MRYRKVGAWDIVFTDPSDRDSAWKIAHNYHVGGAWWTDADFASFRDWSGEISRLAQLPVIAWQIPMGNTIMASCNNTEGHYMDNRPQYYEWPKDVRESGPYPDPYQAGKRPVSKGDLRAVILEQRRPELYRPREQPEPK